MEETVAAFSSLLRPHNENPKAKLLTLLQTSLDTYRNGQYESQKYEAKLDEEDKETAAQVKSYRGEADLANDNISTRAWNMREEENAFIDWGKWFRM